MKAYVVEHQQRIRALRREQNREQAFLQGKANTTKDPVERLGLLIRIAKIQLQKGEPFVITS